MQTPFRTRIAAATCLLIVLLAVGGIAQEERREWVFSPSSLGGDLLFLLPGAGFYTAFLENYAADTTMMVEESNGFSLLDNPRVYMNGEPANQVQWRYGGADTTSALSPGAPGFLVPLAAVNEYRVSNGFPAEHDAGFETDAAPSGANGSRLSLSGVFPDMGGLGPGAETMILNHPYNRADRLYATRRRFHRAWNVSGRWQKQVGKGKLRISLSALERERDFNDFNQRDTMFNESGRALLGLAHYRRQAEKSSLDLYAGINRLSRSALDAELGRLPQEVADLERSALLAGMQWQGRNGEMLRANLLVEDESRVPGATHSKEMMDNDGDGMWPEWQRGDLTAVTATLKGKVPLRRTRGSALAMEADLHQVWNGGDEVAPAMSGMVFAGRPWLGIDWLPGSRYNHRVWNHRLGMNGWTKLSPGLKLLGEAGFCRSGLSGISTQRDFSWQGADWDLGLEWNLSRRSRLRFALGASPLRITPDVGRFLEPRRPMGMVYNWAADINGDGLFQPGEASSLYGLTGASAHMADPDLQAPRREQISLEFSTPISPRWTLDVSGMLKRFRHLLTVDYAAEFGHLQMVDQRLVYLLDRPVEAYTLNNSTFEQDPFYAQLRFAVSGHGRRWLFSFSFMAHMGMGSAPFGNGPVANDLGTLSEWQAGPNARLNAFGRLDGDRAFVARIYSVFDLARNLSLGVSLKYRDGNPFAFIDAVEAGGRRVLLLQTIRAEDRYGRKGGPREDYLSDCSVKISWRLRLLGADAWLSAAVFNLLDFGSELSEYVFSGGSRDAMEMQLPRSLRISLLMSW
ncbi:MAG: hypothetical protein RB296_01355 [Acidobacteriota bacterium]|jgi:hypothetical protein|nr:hypothetical protein [Acidobacteriota bacterium]